MNFEPEVAVVISRVAKNVTVENAMYYMFGCTCITDVTLRDLQGLDPCGRASRASTLPARSARGL